MKIIRFEAKKVNGYLDFDFKFDPSLTFLIGINGSGKTTAIKLILGLLSPSWINLTQIKYLYAEVECLMQNNETIIIRSEYTDTEKIKLSLSSPNITLGPIVSIVRVQDLPSLQIDDFNRMEARQIMSRYSRYESHFVELEAVKKIKEFSTPIFLGLDRRIHEGGEIDILSLDSFMKERDLTTDIRGNLFEGLLDVENLVRKSFLKYSQKQSAIGASLKNKIISSSFNVIQRIEDSFLNVRTNIDLESRKNRIIQASKNFDIPDLREKIASYFEELNRIQNWLRQEQSKETKDQNEDFLSAFSQWFINSSQLERIDNIISLYEEAQNEIVSQYQFFAKFEMLTNRYFDENHKKLRIKKNGEIEIELPNGEVSSIFKLSSGEKQIIVMLSQLLFGKKRQVFIIDEPELSLHLGWQEIFVETLREASPETQFILATHSPSIIGSIENENRCVDLTQSANMYAAL